MIHTERVDYNIPVIDALQTLKADLSINHIDLLKDIKDGPSNVMITCPYHNDGQERRPSMGVKKQGGVCHCFTCGKVVDFPTLVSHCLYASESQKRGVMWLDSHYRELWVQHFQDALNLNSFSRSKEHDMLIIAKSKGAKIDIDLNTGKKIEKHFVSEEELDNYRWTHPYWAKRGIVEYWVIELFDLGYDREKQMITMPVRDEYGRCEFVAKRSVKVKFFQYPPGVSKPLYGLYEMNKKFPPFLTDVYGEKPRSHPTEIIVCESMIDCILLWQSGYCAVALNGLGNERQFKQLRELPCRHLILATDNDEAGQKARARIQKYVTNKLFSYIKFPKDIKDIGECNREQIENILKWERWGWERYG